MMLLSAVLTRFYRSFNFDYLRKYEVGSDRPRSYELVNGEFYPFVRIPIEPSITTVVGANESGKSHLLSAIEKGISGDDIGRDDFCRNSKFFSVEEGLLRWPDFGFEFSGLDDSDRIAIGRACGLELSRDDDSFLLLRTEKDVQIVVLRDGAESKVTAPSELQSILPNIIRLMEDVALPSSVPIRFLVGNEEAAQGLGALQRSQRNRLVERVWNRIGDFSSKEGLVRSADSIVQEMSRLSSLGHESDSRAAAKQRDAERKLAYDLIRKVARIDSEMLSELLDALTNGRDAFANSIITKINEALQAHLNFPHWWAQDREFRLLVSPRDYDLAFTIRDRTEREYAFTERSSGLRYFLSYYIQYLAHERSETKREILLMDEPDAYLSSQGQQDLLKILNAFAYPVEEKVKPTQVIYVTHSPFLIDKNHGERIRVLQKGVGDEGTRVVNDASRNHYEPLRSAFGSFVAETTFIGNCNLIVEGAADQIILGGAASYLRAQRVADIESIDLNHITIVPAGGASHVPYLVFLARGRDVEKPAVIVLLDSDTQGNDAKKAIFRGGPRRNQLLSKEFVLQVGDLVADGRLAEPAHGPVIETEDLIPVEIAVAAARRYVDEVWAPSSLQLDRISESGVAAETASTLFERVQGLLTKIDPDFLIEKVGYARAIVHVVGQMSSAKPRPVTLETFERNMRALFRKLHEMQRAAERELTSERVSSRFNRAKTAFLKDHPTTAKREHVVVLFEEIAALLDDSEESDSIKNALQALRREFKIDESLTEAVDDYERFRTGLDGVRYASRLAKQDVILQETIAMSVRQAETGSRREADTASGDVPGEVKVDAPSATVG